MDQEMVRENVVDALKFRNILHKLSRKIVGFLQ